MTFRFRPLFGFTSLMLPLFATLLGLGAWQLERLQWKLTLIADMDRNMRAAPISIDRALAAGIAAAQYRHVYLLGQYANSDETYVFTTGPHGVPVYHILTPLRLADGRVFMIDRGLVPPAFRDPSTRRAGQLTGERPVVGVLRTPDRPGPFTPMPELPRKIWYARDLQGIAAVNHINLAAPVIVEADDASNPGGWPRGGQTVVDLPNDHLQYAITWFLLAAALAVVYFAYHRSRGRFTIGFP